MAMAQVEVVLVGSSGLGLSAMGELTQGALRWGLGCGWLSATSRNLSTYVTSISFVPCRFLDCLHRDPAGGAGGGTACRESRSSSPPHSSWVSRHCSHHQLYPATPDTHQTVDCIPEYYSPAKIGSFRINNHLPNFLFLSAEN